MSFRSDLTDDLNTNFFNTEEFGELVTLKRGNAEASIHGLFDTPVEQNYAVGTDEDAIAHYPRLFVRQADLPGGKPLKDDQFVLASSEFHSALMLVALDFVFEKDGVVVYRCKYKAITANV